MSILSPSELPSSWALSRIGDVSTINPTFDKSSVPDDIHVSFVPMPAVGGGNGRIDVNQLKRFSEVKRGYTSFAEGDVLFAKITPCMENGKMAVVPVLENSLGFGSTEFHVLRPYAGINAQYLYYFVSSSPFRRDAEHNMTGAVGQRRVPTNYLTAHDLPVPPTGEQRRVVAKIEELFSELDKGIESLTAAREQLQVYRQAILKHAFEGKLTAEWRVANPEKRLAAKELSLCLHSGGARDPMAKEDGDHAVTRPLKKRGTTVKKERPVGELRYQALESVDLRNLPAVPASWAYSRLGQFILTIRAGSSFKCEEREPRPNEIGVAKVSAVSWGEYNESESKTCLDAERVDPELFIRPGNFLLSRANTIHLVGACVIAKRVSRSIMLSDKTLRLTFSAGSKAFFLYYLRSITGRAEIEKRSTGNQESMRNIGQDGIRSLVVPVCSEDEMNEVVERIEAQLTVITALEDDIAHNLRNAAALRQSILKRGFSGALVPQDPKDEPASLLLDRIRNAKEKATGSPKQGNRRGTATSA